ncbi:hypothetical protein NDU88_001345 [Pleurodeles waltl]|uniref:Uncharacterized protein n=1 Tax=Pleurodeles waltl TaxID=8319 RepID=A0AAV7U926_PLEWA|nr:hypothetical protein NDU88_001345 [Pleurodeles waltl]
MGLRPLPTRRLRSRSWPQAFPGRRTQVPAACRREGGGGGPSHPPSQPPGPKQFQAVGRTPIFFSGPSLCVTASRRSGPVYRRSGQRGTSRPPPNGPHSPVPRPKAGGGEEGFWFSGPWIAGSGLGRDPGSRQGPLSDPGLDHRRLGRQETHGLSLDGSPPRCRAPLEGEGQGSGLHDVPLARKVHPGGFPEGRRARQGPRAHRAARPQRQPRRGQAPEEHRPKPRPGRPRPRAGRRGGGEKEV